MAVRGGSQCGYCTPGFICSMAGEYYRTGRGLEARSARTSTDADHEHGPNGFDLHALSGNLCRCTGYRPIRDAAYALGAPLRRRRPRRAARRASAGRRCATRIDGFARPTTLDETFDLLDEGATRRRRIHGLGRRGEPPRRRGRRSWRRSTGSRSCARSTCATDVIELGAALSLTEIERRLAGRVPLLAQLFPQFASRLIRNGATIGGNLGTGVADRRHSPGTARARGARSCSTSRDGDREVPLADYFTGYRQSVRARAS